MEIIRSDYEDRMSFTLMEFHYKGMPYLMGSCVVPPDAEERKENIVFVFQDQSYQDFDYIKRITGYREEMEIAENARGKVHYVLYEDIDGKKHKLKFSCESLAREFQKWFEKQAYEEKNDDKA